MDEMCVSHDKYESTMTSKILTLCAGLMQLPSKVTEKWALVASLRDLIISVYGVDFYTIFRKPINSNRQVLLLCSILERHVLRQVGVEKLGIICIYDDLSMGNMLFAESGHS